MPAVLQEPEGSLGRTDTNFTVCFVNRSRADLLFVCNHLFAMLLFSSVTSKNVNPISFFYL